MKKCIDAFSKQITREANQYWVAKFLLLIFCFSSADRCCAAEPIELKSALLTIVETVKISARRPGLLATVHATEGMQVKPGQLIARIDTTAAKLAVSQAEIEAQVAKQQAEDDINIRLAQKAQALASTELKRAEAVNLQSHNSIPAKEIDRLQLTLENSLLEIERAKHNQVLSQLTHQLKIVALKKSQHDLAMHRIDSPSAGMVVQLNKHAGEMVDTGELIAKIIRVDLLRAEGFVHAKQAALGLVGRKAILKIQVPGRKLTTLDGKVVFVSPEANSVSSQVRIWAVFQRGKIPIRPGLRGQVIIPME